MRDKNTITLALLLAGFASAIYFLSLVGTTLTGFAVGTVQIQESLQINSHFNESDTITFVKENVVKLQITGNASGNGTINLMLEDQLDSYQIAYLEVENQTLSFNQLCIDTCNLSNINTQEISIDVDGNITFYLQTIHYDIQVPSQVDVLTVENQTMVLGETLTLNLDEIFVGEDLFFDAFSSEGYSYEISNSQITYTALQVGEFRAKLYAVDEDIVYETEDFFITINNVTNESNESQNFTDIVITQPIEDNQTNITEINQTNETNVTLEENNQTSTELSDQYNETATQDNQIIIEDDVQEEVQQEESELESEPLQPQEPEQIQEEDTEQEPTQETEQETQTQEQTTQQQTSVDSQSFSTRIETVNSNSLQGVINQGTQITVIENYYSQNTPQRNEVIAFNHALEGEVYKIIRGVSGDSFSVENNRIIINGNILTNGQGEQYVISNRAQNLLRLYERDYNNQIPQNAYLILGNVVNRDTGSARFGLVHISDFEGRVST